jgi:hypothetical protein
MGIPLSAKELDGNSYLFPDRYRYSNETRDTLVNQIVDCFRSAVPLDHQPSNECIDGREIQPRARCGHPRANVQNQDCQCVFFDQLHKHEASDIHKASIFFVRRCVYFAFFGKLAGDTLDSSMDIEDSPVSGSPSSPLFIDQSPFPEPGHNAYPDASRHISGREESQRRETAREEQRR